MEIASRESLLNRTNRRYTEVTVDGVKYRIQSLTEGEKSRYENSITNSKGSVKLQARMQLLIATVVDDEGNRLFTSDDYSAMAQVDGALTGKLFNAAIEHCGFQEADIDELVKNSEATRNGSSV